MRNNPFHWLVIGISLVLLACSREQPPISAAAMEKIMFEVYLTESLIANELIGNHKLDQDIIRQRQQDFIFKKYQVTRDQYDSTLSFLGRNLTAYIGITDQIEKRIKEEQTRLVNQKESDSLRQIMDEPLLADSLLLAKANNTSYSSYNLMLDRHITLQAQSGSFIHARDTIELTLRLPVLAEAYRSTPPNVTLTLNYLDSVVTKTTTVESAGLTSLRQVVDPQLILLNIEAEIRLSRTWSRLYFITVDNIFLRRYLYKERSEANERRGK